MDDTMKILLVCFLIVTVVSAALAADDAAARKALNDQRYLEAAELYAELRAAAKTGNAIGDAIYWEAFARYRLDRTSELKKALELLDLQKSEYADAPTAADGEALAARIAGELASRGEPGAAREIYQLADEDRQREETRIAALHALSEMDPAKALPILEKLVRDREGSSQELRQNAAFILCRMESGPAVLLTVLPSETDPAMQETIVMCLGEVGDERSFTILTDLLQRTQDPVLSEAIVISLGRRQDARTAGFLSGLVRDPQREPGLRAQALLGLAESSPEQAVELAMQLLPQPDQPEQLLEIALMTLARSESDRATDALLAVVKDPQASDEVRGMALYNAGTSGRLGVDQLRAIYDSTESGNLRIQVCHVLSQMDDQPGALDLMLHIVRTEPDPEIRQNAVYWIGHFDDPRAADALLEIINER